jgi:hypothetical protein
MQSNLLPVSHISSSTKTLTPNPNSTQINSTTNSQTPWKVYTTNKFGFSIEYPQSWIISEKQNKYEIGVELTIESPDIWDPNNGRFNFVAALPVHLTISRR